MSIRRRTSAARTGSIPSWSDDFLLICFSSSLCACNWPSIRIFEPQAKRTAKQFNNLSARLPTKEGGALVAGQSAVVKKTSTVDEDMLLLLGVRRLIHLRDRFL